MNQVSAYLRHFLDAFLEPVDGESEAAVAARRAFVGGHLLLTLCGLALVPPVVAFSGTLSLAVALTFAWLAAPLGAALLAARTGDLVLARLHYCGFLTGFIVWVAMLTGGAASSAALWLALVPIEASLSNSRRLIVFASGLALLAWLALNAIAAIPFVPRAAGGAELARFMPLAGLLYAAALGLRLRAARAIETARTGGDLLRFRRLAEGSPDLLTEHGSDGGVLYASPAATALLAADATSLAGGGLLERIHIGDRPAWLTALSRALAKGVGASALVRVRVGERGRDGAERFAAVEMVCRRIFDHASDSYAVVATTRERFDAPTFAANDSAYDGRVVRIGGASGTGPIGQEQRVEGQPASQAEPLGHQRAAAVDGAARAGGLDAERGGGAERQGVRQDALGRRDSSERKEADDWREASREKRRA